MTSEDWKAFYAGLKAKGIVGPYSTLPSVQTIAMVIVEMRKLEKQTRPAVAVHVRRRVA